MLGLGLILRVGVKIGVGLKLWLKFLVGLTLGKDAGIITKLGVSIGA